MVQPGRMARRHPHRTANRTTGIRRPPPIRPPPVRPHQPVPELGRDAWSNPGREPGALE